MAAVDLSRVFKAYDVRGVVPDELDPAVVRRIGAAFAAWSGASEILIGRDCRSSSPELAVALTTAEERGDLGIDRRPAVHRAARAHLQA